MNRLTRSLQKRNRSAFSLAEVTISIGVMTAVVLPTLALLSSGNRLHQTSIDQRVAADIAETLVTALNNPVDQDAFSVRLLKDAATARMLPPAAESSSHFFLLADQAGNILQEIPEESFSQPILQSPDSAYAIKVSIKTSTIRGITSDSIFEVNLLIQSPSLASEINREQYFFVTLVSAP